MTFRDEAKPVEHHCLWQARSRHLAIRAEFHKVRHHLWRITCLVTWLGLIIARVLS